MPRKARKYVRAPFYHVMCQGIKKEKIFNEKEHIEKYLQLLNKYKGFFCIDIISYCIMPNHVHLLIHSPTIELLSKFMHKLNSIYATYYNDFNGRVGYVFRDRFKLEEICEMTYLFNCITYIHNNPVAAKLCDSPQKYPYSSYNEFVSVPKTINITLLNQILGQDITTQIQQENPIKNLNFLDVDIIPEEKANEIILEFQKHKNKQLTEILQNYHDRKELLIQLHIKNNISLRCIEKVLNINRKKINTYLYPNQQ